MLNILATIDLEAVVNIARDAGNAIMINYRPGNEDEVVVKEDKSLVTMADLMADKFITAQLKMLYPDIPVISEEGEKVPYEIRAAWKTFWLVDPLDGTREYLSKNGEFTVNIALIIDQRPALGVIYAPAFNQMFYGSLLHGAFKQTGGYLPQQIVTKAHSRKMVAVHSRSHSSPQEEKVLQALGAKDRLQIGSSLKFCLVADGTASLYYRHRPTMEWDTAAGQALVEAAGGSVTTPNRKPLQYNKQSLRNSSFLCMA
ncbi:MAG: 3'(2'),5'-bisphosphate nucleotidase [Chitinophagaceae bacterium]|nr:MAG: 3'(2'),5'-bisphosphate nucleotidase [Chitinophagaceae bacterium]